MDLYQFYFEYNNTVIMSGTASEMTAVADIPSGGDASLIEWTQYDETIESRVGQGFITPSTSIKTFLRIPTDVTLDDAGTGVWLTSTHHNIRFRMRLTHSGTIHSAVISDFEKITLDEHGETVYVSAWAGDPISITWDSDAQRAGYLAVYQGYANYKVLGDNIPSIGFQFMYQYNGQYEYSSGTVLWQINMFNDLPDPENTYEPTDNNIVIGGTGNGDYPSDPAERPNVGNLNNWFAFGSSNGKGLTYYDVLISDIYDVFSKIYSDSYINLETRLKAIIDCFRIPFTVGVGSQIARINVADVPVSVSGAYPLTQRFKEFDFPIVDLTNAGWDDYNDFSNTRATLYLPFVGRINIDINAIARGTIEVVAVGDAYTGNITYWVYTTSMNAPREILYGVYEGQSAVQIPIAATYTPNLMGKIMASAGILGGGLTAAVMSNPMGAAVAAGALIATAPSALEQSVDTTHVQDSASNATSPLHIRLDISRREMIRPAQYREVAGIPAFTTEVLRNLEGFVRVHSADYDGLKCEQPEKEVIKSMLEEGVYV